MELPSKIVLTSSEIIEIRTYNAQKQIYALERDKVLLQEDAWLNKLSERLQLDARQYRIDIQTGVGLLTKPEQIEQKVSEAKTPEKVKSQDEANDKLQTGHSVRKQPKGSAP